MQDRLSAELRDRVLIFDGAMGTEIYNRHFFVNTSFEGLCLVSPDVVRDIHRLYAEAGADVLTTNSYAANGNKLGVFGLSDRVADINVAAARLAREEAGPGRLVAGSVGPVGELPYGVDAIEERLVGILVEQVAALADGGVDFILFETLSSSTDLRRALAAMARRPDLPYVVSFAVDRNGDTAKGESLRNLLAEAEAATPPPAAIGLNCGSGPEAMLGALEVAVGATARPLIVQPNAGTPKNVDGRMIYMTSPEYLATYAKRFLDLGARAVGGCCGTGPSHIREIARQIRPLTAHAVTVQLASKPIEAPLREPAPTAQKSLFGAKLARGEWVTSVEIVPPRGFDLGPTVERARQCREAGVDAINIPDGPRASARLSPLVTAIALQRDAGIEAVLHFCARDRSLLGVQADLLGCAAAGVRNLLFITGDPPKLGDFPFSSAVFDADSIGLVKIQDRMNRGVDLGGKPLAPPTRALIGVGADPNAIDMKRELRRTREKAAAGAEFVITQPVFAVEPLLAFLDAIADLRLPVIAGIWPLASYRNAEFMKNEVPGVIVPDEIMRRMAGASTKEAQREEGIRIARESVAAIRDRVAGVQVSAPMSNVQTAIAVMRGF